MTRFEASAHIGGAPELVFTRLDDPMQLAGHMQSRSMIMGGDRMRYELDEKRGRDVGSAVKMTGSAFGLSIEVVEEIVERDPPHRKRWATIGRPELLVLDRNEMGFALRPDGDGSALRVWIDYQLPFRACAVDCAPHLLPGSPAGASAGSSRKRWDRSGRREPQTRIPAPAPTAF